MPDLRGNVMADLSHKPDLWHNGEFRNALICLAVFLLFIGAAAAPFLLGWDLMNVGFGVAFISLFVSCFFLIGLLFYVFRAWKLQKIFGGQDVLAHWTYERKFWEQFANEDQREEGRNKHGLWLLVAVSCVVVSIPFLILDWDSGLVVAAVLFGLIVITGLLSVAVPAYTRWQRMGRPGEVIIAKNGVWLAGALHLWEPRFMFFFDGVELRPGSRPVLVFAYSAAARYGYQQEFVRVPVPPDKLAEAKRIVALLGKQAI